MIGCLLLSAIALAEPPGAEGHVLLEVSPGTRVNVFPSATEGQHELALYGNRVDLAPQLEGRSARYLLDMATQSIGAGTWFVTLATTEPDVGLDWSWHEGRLLLTLAPAQPESTVEPTRVDLEALLGTDEVRDPQLPMRRTLTPLPGDALTVTIDPKDYPLARDPWSAGQVDMDTLVVLTAADHDSDEAIAGYRGLLASDNPVARYNALHELARAHGTRGMPRDALAYIEWLLEQEADFERAQLHLERARLAVRVGRNDVAAESCHDAHAAGADAEAVLQCVGLVSLATSHPPPTATARLLMRSTELPEAQLLAAQLLMLDNRHMEAGPVLEGALPRLDGPLEAMARMNLGDVRYAAGDLDGAREAWNSAAVRGELRRVARLRLRMAQLEATPVAERAAITPELQEVARRSGPAGAEAIYLLAQLGALYDDPDMATAELSRLMDRYPDIAGRSDVPRLLMATCTARLDQLNRAGRLAAEVGMFRDCWRPEFREYSGETRLHDRIARSLDRMGLPQEALAVNLAALAIEVRHNTPSDARLLTLGDLYVRTGRAQEARDTVAWARRRTRLATGALDLLDGRALLELGSVDEALERFSAAARSPEHRVEARLRHALASAEAGRCDEARDVLDAVAAGPASWHNRHVALDSLHLARARCQLESNAPDEAIASAVAASMSSADPWVGDEALHLAAVAGTQANGEVPREVGRPHGIWAALLKEEAENRAFEREIARVRGDSDLSP